MVDDGEGPMNEAVREMAMLRGVRCCCWGVGFDICWVEGGKTRPFVLCVIRGYTCRLGFERGYILRLRLWPGCFRPSSGAASREQARDGFREENRWGGGEIASKHVLIQIPSAFGFFVPFQHHLTLSHPYFPMQFWKLGCRRRGDKHRID